MREIKDYSKTLIIKADTPGLQYDINGILKSFYPEIEVRVLTMDDNWEVAEAVHDEEMLKEPTCMDVKLEEQKLVVYFLPDVINDKTSGEALREFVYEVDEELGNKNTFKRFFYDAMCELTGRYLPWGNLTGIRPTKIVKNLIEAGNTEAEIRIKMQNFHRISEEKLDLSLDIARREISLLSRLDYNSGYSLYIGIPFCPTTCLYCSFTSYPIAAWSKRIDEYLDALELELKYVAYEYSMNGLSKKHPDTIYIGGGTPTSLDESHLERLLEMITSNIDISSSIEFTCEAGRPDSITPEKLRIMKKYGVTRISVNPQTMQQKTLDLIGRKVSVAQIEDSFYAAREAGHDNINMDIILGLPGETELEVEDTLSKIARMNPDSLTVHSLAIKRASALKKRLDEIGIDALKNTDTTMSLAENTARSMAMNPYYLYRQKNMSGNFENVGYAKEGKAGIYNILIMEEVQTIIACGAGTVTKRVYPDGRIERSENIKDVALYIEKIDEMIERKRTLFSDEN